MAAADLSTEPQQACGMLGSAQAAVLLSAGEAAGNRLLPAGSLGLREAAGHKAVHLLPQEGRLPVLNRVRHLRVGGHM